MDSRVELIRRYYRSLPSDRVKLECRSYGFPFLASLLKGGCALQYGELTSLDCLHKYKLSGVSPGRLDSLLGRHVEGSLNTCLYFAADSNALLCFNLDDNRADRSGGPPPEIDQAAEALEGALRSRGAEPLVIASGRGYHAWCRLASPASNAAIHAFMLRCAAEALAVLQAGGGDRRRLKFNFYPDPRIQDAVSLRLFGSIHVKTRQFSRVRAHGRLLDERASWEAFGAHLAADSPVEVLES